MIGLDSPISQIATGGLLSGLSGLSGGWVTGRGMFGTAGNFRALQQIARATGGVAFDITSPKQIGSAFFSGIAQRLSVAG